MRPPWPDGDKWDKVKLGGMLLPGLCKVSIKISDKYEDKEPKGGHGATQTFQGYAPAQVKITLRMWRESNDEDSNPLGEWADIVKRIRPRKGTPSKQTIEHPKTAMYDIPAVSIRDISDDADKGDYYEVQIETKEFAPSPKKPATKTEKTLDPHAQILGEDIEVPPKPGKPSAAGAGSPEGGAGR